MTTAYERAIKGGIREMWKDGVVVAEVRQPSDRLLIWLLDRVAPAPVRHAAVGDQWGRILDWSAGVTPQFGETLGALADSAVPAEPLTARHYQPSSLVDGREALSPPTDEDADDDYDYEDG
ncbi:hypothetical protein OK349_09590 [Sphingomonas sp. BT-65]|uniref:hypothetical protein n=1 Tax=Sphingomonas sp. BT-65 TaxID=2989821 RepID=UPI0022363646|nr:hypothetical protein [Sphingomonas sp. BT-65]MCW4461958.1 hypothetical protein [Sphingomonas sp. BT-65]